GARWPILPPVLPPTRWSGRRSFLSAGPWLPRISARVRSTIPITSAAFAAVMGWIDPTCGTGAGNIIQQLHELQAGLFQITGIVDPHRIVRQVIADLSIKAPLDGAGGFAPTASQPAFDHLGISRNRHNHRVGIA